MHYRIIDEPQPGALARLTVHPLWPLLGFMFGGVWLAWPWFAVNSFALGSPTRNRELVWLIAGIVITIVLVFVLMILVQMQILQGSQISYALLVVTVWKLTVSYAVFALQQRTFELYEYYGGAVAQGWLVIIIAFFVGRSGMEWLPNDFWLIVLR